MNALLGIGLFSTVIHSLIYDWTFLKIYLLLLPLYLVFILLTKNIKENPKRKTLMLATWNGKKSLNNNFCRISRAIKCNSLGHKRDKDFAVSQRAQ
jgi:hypothetical protein